MDSRITIVSPPSKPVVADRSIVFRIISRPDPLRSWMPVEFDVMDGGHMYYGSSAIQY
jgi:hypothetical protein